MTDDPTTPRTYSVRELAKLEVLQALAEEIAAAVFNHVEREGTVVKAQLAEKIHFALLSGKAAKALWAEPPAAEPPAAEPPAQEPSRARAPLPSRWLPPPPPCGLTVGLAEEDRHLIRDALRQMAGRDARTADSFASSRTPRDNWVRTLRERVATATRLADTIADGAEVELRPRPD